MDYYLVIKKEEVLIHITTWMLKSWWEEAKLKKPCTVWFHIYKLSRTGKFTQIESRLVAAQGKQKGWEIQVSFWGDVNALKLYTGNGCKHCEYNKNKCIVHFKMIKMVTLMCIVSQKRKIKQVHKKLKLYESTDHFLWYWCKIRIPKHILYKVIVTALSNPNVKNLKTKQTTVTLPNWKLITANFLKIIKHKSRLKSSRNKHESKQETWNLHVWNLHSGIQSGSYLFCFNFKLLIKYIYHFPYSSPNASTKVYDLLYFLPTVSIISITVSVLMSPAPYHCPTPYCGYWTSFPGHKVSFMKPPCLFWHPSPPPCPMTSHEILIINGISDNRSSWTRKILEVP